MGMLLFQLIRGYFDAETASQEELEVKKEVFSYFGTFYRTIITMFEITLANWAPSCRLLIDNVSEWYGLFYILYRCMFCFAVVKVVLERTSLSKHRLNCLGSAIQGQSIR
eukprot:2098200-Amphidinium_carterae.1